MLHMRTKTQRGISLSVTHAPVRTHTHVRAHTHTHTLCGSSAGHRVEGRLALADHTVLFIMSFSTQAFNSGRVEVGGQATPGMQGLGFSGSNLPPAASGRVGVLGEISTRTFPNCPWQFPPECTCRGPWCPATGRADTAAWLLISPRQAPEAYRPRDRMAFPAGCQLTSVAALWCGQGSQGAFCHQEPGFFLVEALSLHSQR